MSDQLGTGNQDPVFLDYSQEALDQALDQQLHAPNWREMVGQYEEASKSAWAQLQPAAESYGPDPGERIDFYRASGGEASPLLILLHGGGWRMMGRRDVAYAAPTFLDSGIAVAAPSYGLLPTTRIMTMAERCRRVVAWAYREADRLGVDPTRIYVGGLSAGAHLASVLLATDWPSHGLPIDVVRGAMLVSGIYDMTPLARSSVYGYVDLDAEEITALSPLLHAGRCRAPALIAWGDHEPPEFARQAGEFFHALREHHIPCADLLVKDRTHFEIALDLASRTSALSRAAIGLILSRGADLASLAGDSNA